METQTGPAERCAECRGLCVVAGSDLARANPALPVLARRADGAAVCDGCVARHDRFRLTDGTPVVAYMSSDGLNITTWGGHHIARVIRASTHRNGWHGSELTYWHAVMPNGREVYGRGAGRGMSTTARPCRVR